MNIQAKHTFKKPQNLPFLKAVCWDLRDVNLLTQDEILDRYERGWDYKDILTDIPPKEKQYIVNLAREKGSWLQISV